MDKISKYLQHVLDRSKTPSISYLLFNQETCLYSFFGGQADVESNIKADNKTAYCGFSVTKTFTALAVMQLVENGWVDLDKQASFYIQQFPYGDDITVRHLLTHTSGISNPLPLRWVHSPNESNTFNRDVFFKEKSLKHKKLLFDPNAKFSYSNIGYYWLGKLIEVVSELSYEVYVQKNIIDRIGLKSDVLGFDYKELTSIAKGYQKRGTIMNFLLDFLMDKSKYANKKEGQWLSFHPIKMNGPSHGGLMGTPQAFMKYIQELLNENSKLISSEFKKLLFTENLTNSNKETGMCLSWFKGQLNDKTYYAHAGGGAGYYCELRIYPEDGLGSVVMTNRTGVKDERLLSKLDSLYFQ